MINPFFTNKGPFRIDKLLKLSELKNNQIFNKIKISDIKDLVSATKNDITFFHSKKYESLASKTNALFCITTKSLEKILPSKCHKIIVENVLMTTAKITKSFYPDAVMDHFDNEVKDINKTSHKKKVYFGKNVLSARDPIGLNLSPLRGAKSAVFVSTGQELADLLSNINKLNEPKSQVNDFFYLDHKLLKWKKLFNI